MWGARCSWGYFSTGDFGHSCKNSYSVAGISSNSRCSDWYHDPISKEKESMRHFFHAGLLTTLNLILTLSRCRESLFSSKRKRLWFTSFTAVKNKVIPMNEIKPSKEPKCQISTRGSDEWDPKLCFISASHPFFFRWLLLTAALIRNSQDILFLKKNLEKHTWLSSLVLSHNVHAFKRLQSGSH